MKHNAIYRLCRCDEEEDSHSATYRDQLAMAYSLSPLGIIAVLSEGVSLFEREQLMGVCLQEASRQVSSWNWWLKVVIEGRGKLEVIGIEQYELN